MADEKATDRSIAGGSWLADCWPSKASGPTETATTPSVNRGLLENQYPRQGLNNVEISREIHAVDGQGDSQSDSLGGVVDPRLALLIEVWPVLDDDVKAEIVRLASYDVDDVTLAVAR